MVQSHLLVAKTGTEPCWLWHTAQTPPPPAPLLWAHSACRQLGVLVVETKSPFPLQEFPPSLGIVLCQREAALPMSIPLSRDSLHSITDCCWA